MGVEKIGAHNHHAMAKMTMGNKRKLTRLPD